MTPQFSLFPKFSSSFIYRKCSTRYLEALRGEGLCSRNPLRLQTLRKQRANVQHHGVIPVLPPRRRVVRLLGRPMTPRSQRPNRTRSVRDPCATPAELLRDSVPSISGMVPKHFDLLSSKMMLRSLPEVVRSSKNGEIFKHKTCCDPKPVHPC